MVTLQNRLPSSGDTSSTDDQPARARAHGPAVMLVVAVGVWAVALSTLRHVEAGTYGLLATSGGALLGASACVTLAAFLWAIAVHRTVWAVLAIVVMALIARVTATLLTEMPLYVWTYKHIGIAEYMIDGHASPSIQIYGDWPSFFALMAWFSSVSGVDSLTVAHWFAPVSSSLLSLLVGTLVVSAGFGARAGLIAAMLALIMNWTGQDYYSPQAAGLILTLSILTLVLYSKTARIAGYLAIPLAAVLVATHQLTPFWLFFVLAALAVFRQMRPWWLPVVYLTMLAVYVVPRLNRAAKFDVFSGFNPLKNSTVVAEAPGSAGREFTILLERGLFVGLWILAAVCFIVIWRRHGAPWGFAVLAFSPAMILAGQDYGGEAIIRVFLYSIAGCSALLAVVAVLLIDFESPWPRVIGCAVTALVAAAIGAVGLQGYYSGWSYVTVTRSQVEHSRNLLAQTEGKYVVGTLAQNVGWPEGSTADAVRLRLLDPAYDSVFDGVRPHLLHKDFATPQDVSLIESTFQRNGRARALYVILPRQVRAYGEYQDWFPQTYVPSLIDLLSRTPLWSRVIDDEHTVVFEYRPQKKR
ncbi:hypothetical protein [Mycolicibacterium austroafricanum]|uniref:hypothetical protein n=1 Tax=Mycolicibacterium austroafricanum TaxID=39687 RepID=UPI000CF865BA|nr:hypothetical protein [Mycolicibacterium austroafricanum]PQP46269.1 hypothetical protein C6A88_18370 [Mycolicibacterium austroafricanum]